MADGTSGWSFAFHEFPYDVYARILPGILVVAMELYVYICIRHWITRPSIGWTVAIGGGEAATLTFVGLIVAWAIGMLISAAGASVYTLSSRSKEVFLKMRKRYKSVYEGALNRGLLVHNCDNSDSDSLDDLKACCDVLHRSIYHQLHEQLKAARSDWQSILMKIQAEAMFYADVLAAAALLIPGNIALVWVFYSHSNLRVWQFWVAIIVPFLILACLAFIGWRDKVFTQWERHFAILKISLQDRPLSIFGTNS